MQNNNKAKKQLKPRHNTKIKITFSVGCCSFKDEHVEPMNKMI